MEIEIPESSFVVLSQQRSGSHLLQGLLNSHPEVMCHGELFHHGIIDNEYPDLSGLPCAESVIFAGLNLSKNAANGFIVQDSQRGQTAFLGWDHTLLHRCNPRPRIIWLQRRNTIAQYASWLVALRTAWWVKKNEDNPRSQLPPGFLNPSPTEAAEWIHSMREDRDRLKTEFQEYDSHEIFYEDLVKSPQKVCDSIFHFLGLSIHPVSPSTFQQRSYRYQEIFQNYEEIICATVMRQRNAR